MTTNLPTAEPEPDVDAMPPATPIADAADNADEQVEVEDTNAPTAKSPIRTTIKVAPEDEPYLPGQCTVSIVLTLQPNDEHPDGRQVLIGVRSHDEEPLIGLARLNSLSLPGEIVQLLERYEVSLPALGQAKAERETQEKAKQEQAEARRKQAQAKKAAQGAKAETSKAKKAMLAPPPEAPQPAVLATPSTPAAEGTSPTSDTAPAPAPAAQITLFG